MIRYAKTYSNVAPLMWVVDMTSLIRDTGRQIDWDLVSEKYSRGSFKVKLAEAVDKGETAITVDALEGDLKKGDELDFGTAVSVTVTVGAAGASANATSVPVDELTGPLPVGTLLDFGGKKFARLSAAAVDGDTTIAVDALATALVDNDTANYIGGDKVLKLAADAAQGATTITVEPPQFALADNAEAWAISSLYEGQNRGALFIPSGTVMVEVDHSTNRKIVPISIYEDYGATEEKMVLLTDAKTDSKTDAETGYGVTFGGTLYENLMPDAFNNAGVFPDYYKQQLGTRYIWKLHRDSRGA